MSTSGAEVDAFGLDGSDSNSFAAPEDARDIFPMLSVLNLPILIRKVWV